MASYERTLSSGSSDSFMFGRMSGVSSGKVPNPAEEFLHSLQSSSPLPNLRVFGPDVNNQFPIFLKNKYTPRSKLQFSFEHDASANTYRRRVPGALELLKKSGVRLTEGSWQCREDKVQIDLTFVDASGQSVPSGQGEKIEQMVIGSKQPVLVLDPEREMQITSVLVAGMDVHGVLRKISARLANAKFDIVATSLRTQGRRLASIFFVKSEWNRRKEKDQLEEVREYLEGQKNLLVHIQHQEEVLVSETWLNWELSRNADEMPTPAGLPANVTLDVTRLNFDTVEVKVTSDDKGHEVFDTISTFCLNGYDLIEGSFKVVTRNDTGAPQVEQEYKLRFDSSSLQGEENVRKHLKLAFWRRETEGERFELEAADKQGLLHDWASVFHDKWWSVTRADVEVVDNVGKTIIYAQQLPGGETIELLTAALQDKGFRVR